MGCTFKYLIGDYGVILFHPNRTYTDMIPKCSGKSYSQGMVKIIPKCHGFSLDVFPETLSNLDKDHLILKSSFQNQPVLTQNIKNHYQ